jgi:LysR family transcriptional activator of glutamate synthase operon
MSQGPYNPIDMKSLLCFATMVKHGSLTQASIELGISDAAVSQRIKSLEKHLGRKLYEARGGKVGLTDAGEQAKTFALRILDEIHEFEKTVGDDEFRGTITIGSTSHIIRNQLPDIVRDIRRKYPFAQLRLLNCDIPDIIGRVRRNDIDLGILPAQRALTDDLIFHPWRTFRGYVLVPNDHPLARRKAPTLQDLMDTEILQNYPQVVASFGSQEDRIKQAMDKVGLPFYVSLEVGDVETLKIYVARGHGLAIVNGACLTPEDETVFHKIRIPSEYNPDTTYGILLRRDKHLSRPIQTILELFKESSD